MQPEIRLMIRLLEESQLDIQHLYIGYLANDILPDEEPVELFLWKYKEIISQDYFDLLANCRILYLKYDAWIVWDRNSEYPFYEVLRQCLQAQRCSHLLQGLENGLSIQAMIKNSVEKDEVEHKQPQHPSQEWQDLEDAFWFKPGEPNFILCQRVHSNEFNRRFVEVAREFCHRESKLKHCFYHPAKFHLTLCVFALRNLEEAKVCFDTIGEIINSTLHLIPTEPIRLCGLGCYSGRIMYVSADRNPMLEKFINHLKQSLDNAGFVTNVHPQFDPHVTLMKFPPDLQNELSIPNEWLKDFQTVDFGCINLSEFYFCLRSPGVDGFYIPVGRFVLNGNDSNYSEI